MEPVHIRVEHSFAPPRDRAYLWLTDFDEGDVERAEGAVLEKRKVLERAKDRVVYEGETAVLGRRTWSVTEVQLTPPDRWEAKVTKGPRTGSFTHYRLVPKGDGCHITVDYHFVLDKPARMLLLRLAKPLVKRDLARMWDGFANAMQRELRE
jgi:hypothetical protein